jgi:outer membrane protein
VIIVAAGGVAAAADQDAGVPGGPLTLDQCINIAWENHSRVAIAQESIVSGEQGVRRDRASWYPDIGTQWQYQYSESRGGGRYTEVGGLPYSIGAVTAETHQTTLYTNYTLWNSGYREVNLHLSKTQLKGLESDLEAVRHDLAYQVTSDYYGLLQARRNLEIATEAADLAQRNLDAVEARIETEVAAQTDRYPFRSELFSARLNVVRAQNAANVAATQLRNSLGLGLGPPLELVEPGEPQFADLDLDALLKVANESRPELTTAAADIEGAKLRVRLAKMNRDPYLTVDGRYTYKPEPSPWGSDWTLSAAVSLPVFDGGDLAAQQRSAETGLRQSELRYAQLEKDTAAEVESAYFDVIAAKPSYEAASAGVEEAKANLDVMTEKNRLGMAIPLEVVDAQVSYSNAQLREAQARYEYRVALGRLGRAIGAALPAAAR